MENLKDSINLKEYIKSQLNTLDYKNNQEYTNNKKIAKKCLQDIGKSLGQYTNFHHILNSNILVPSSPFSIIP